MLLRTNSSQLTLRKTLKILPYALRIEVTQQKNKQFVVGMKAYNSGTVTCNILTVRCNVLGSITIASTKKLFDPALCN